jgi:hypothetical protein
MAHTESIGLECEFRLSRVLGEQKMELIEISPDIRLNS